MLSHNSPGGSCGRVSAPVKGFHLIFLKGIHLQQRRIALANREADIVATPALHVYVSNFSRIPVRLVKGMNFGTLRQLTTKPLSPSKTEREPLLLVDEGSTLEEGEGNRGSPLFAEAMEEHMDSETEAEIFASWEDRIASSLDGLHNQSLGYAAPAPSHV